MAYNSWVASSFSLFFSFPSYNPRETKLLYRVLRQREFLISSPSRRIPQKVRSKFSMTCLSLIDRIFVFFSKYPLKLIVKIIRNSLFFSSRVGRNFAFLKKRMLLNLSIIKIIKSRPISGRRRREEKENKEKE